MGVSRLRRTLSSRVQQKHPPTQFGWEEVDADVVAQVHQRDGALVFWMNDKWWIFGGWDGNGVAGWSNQVTTNEVYSSPDGITWTRHIDHVTVPPAPPDAAAIPVKRHYGGGLVVNFDGTDYFVVIGGDHYSNGFDAFGLGVSNGYQCDVWRTSDPSTKPWERMCESDDLPFTGRMLVAYGAIGETIYAAGGQDGIIGPPPFPFTYSSGDFSTYYNDVWKSEDCGATWTQCTASAPWSGRGVVNTMPYFLGKLWLVCGGRYPVVDYAAKGFMNSEASRSYSQEVWSTEDGVSWTQHSNFPGLGRQYHGCFAFGERLWVVGGFASASNRADVWSTGNGEDWVQHEDTPFTAGHADGFAVGPDSVLHVTGNSSLNSLSVPVHKLVVL